MRRFWILLKFNFRALLCGFGFGRKKSKAISGVAALALVGALTFGLSCLFCASLAVPLHGMGLLSLLVPVMALVGVMLALMFTLFGAQSVLFGGRDNDLMLSMPVSAFTFLLSRVLALYLEGLFYCALTILPAGIFFLANGGGGGAFFLLRLLLGILLLALLPTLFSLVLGYLLSWISSKFGKSSALTSLLYLVFYLLLMALMFRFSFSGGAIAPEALANVRDLFAGWGLPFLLLESGVCSGDALALGGLAALCLLPFFLVSWLFSIRYKKILAGLGAQKARSNYKLRAVSSSGAFSALLRVEGARFLSTPIYVFNTGFGLLLLLLAGVASLVLRQKMLEILSAVGLNFSDLPLLTLLAFIVAFCVITVAITACSISLEGRQLWIVKGSPVPTQTIFLAKATFQLLLVLPCVLLCSLCLFFAFSLTVPELLALLAAETALAVASAFLGLFVNLWFPNLDATSDAAVVKRSTATIVNMLLSFALLLAGGLIFFFFGGALQPVASLLLCALLYALLAGVFVALLRTRGVRAFAAL